MQACIKNIICGSVLLSAAGTASAVDYTELNLEQLIEIDVYIPNILSAHSHKENEIMFGYSVATMQMKGLQQGRQNVSVDAALAKVGRGYNMVPTEMDMNMQMFHFMYATSNKLTWMLNLKYLKYDMNMQNQTIKTSSETAGWGDSQIKVNYRFHQIERQQHVHQFTATFGLSLPTGGIIHKGPSLTHGDMTMQLPYVMQLGSGTFDPIVGVAYSGFGSDWFWGGQLLHRLSGQTNSQGYKKGYLFSAKSWLHYSLKNNISLYGELNYQQSGLISGIDSDLSEMSKQQSASANELFSGRKSMVVVFGSDITFDSQALKGHRLSFEIEKPLSENVNGLQLKQYLTCRIGWQVTF